MRPATRRRLPRSGLARAACTALALAMAGCASAPSAVVSALTPSPAGRVLGRDARFVIYEPGPDDTLASLAKAFLGSTERAWTIADFNDIDRVTAGQPLVVPLAEINPLGVRANEVQTVPILCYHRFGPAHSKMTVTPTQFAAQLDWLEKNDYRVIPLRRLIGFLAGREALPKRAVVITIDDGHESAYQYALPLLRKHGFPATLFVYTDYIGAGGGLTWPQLHEIAASGEFEVGGHSKTHRNLAARNPGEGEAAYRKDIAVEVHQPIETLSHRLEHPVDLYAFPYGDANALVLDLLAKDRVALAASVTPGGNAFYAQPLLLRRTMIFGDHDLEAFKARLQVSRKLTGEP